MALLRASGQNDGREYGLGGVMDGAAATGVACGAELLALADAALQSGDLGRARAAVQKALGDDALVDAAAVIGGFDGITRIADAIGIPLEASKAEQTADFYQALGIGVFRHEKA